MRLIASLLLLFCAAGANAITAAQSPDKWVVSWVGSVQGPYPTGNPSAQPDLKLAFPSAEAGARDQSFRLIVKPESWGAEVRRSFHSALHRGISSMRLR